MNILVLNAGSSSLKYELMVVETHEVLAKGICECIGSEASFTKHGVDSGTVKIDVHLPNHEAAIAFVLDYLLKGEHAVISSLDQIDAIGHRIVQGGKYFNKSVLVDEGVISKIEELAELAPLHNIAAIQGIRACQNLMPDTPMVCVFDTSFFQTLPTKAYMYPIPLELSDKYSIRRYGAHGTSHRYIASRAATLLGEPLSDLKLITCHLGNGASIAAVDHGIAVDTSMGLTPLDGLMMGTRSGSIDPAIVLYLMKHENLTPDEMDDLLNRKSGILGVSGVSNDLRMVRNASEAGDERAMLAYEMFAHSVRKTIGAYMAIMGGVDAIVLSAGIGENCDKMRRYIFSGLQPLGIILDLDKNHAGEPEREISTEESTVKILVVPTDEEYMIAYDTYELVNERLR